MHCLPQKRLLKRGIVISGGAALIKAAAAVKIDLAGDETPGADIIMKLSKPQSSKSSKMQDLTAA